MATYAQKVGFLKACADRGMSSDEVRAHIDQLYGMAKQGGTYLDSILAAGTTTLFGPLLAGALAGGPVGYVLGQAAGHMQDAAELDPPKRHELADTYQKQRIIDLYREHAIRAEQRAEAARRRAAMQAGRPRNFRGI